MSKSHDIRREQKKAPQKTLKERRQEKREKKNMPSAPIFPAAH